jgi:hypothetical protein
MLPKNYYGFDIIHTKDDELKIIDTHGLSDAISFSEKAGYKPRLSRIYRFMDALKEMRQGGEKILYLYNQTERKPYNFPKSLNEFYESLPQGTAHLDWRKRQKRFFDSLTEGLFKKELVYLTKAAKRTDVDFVIGTLNAYLSKEESLFFTQMDINKMLEWKEITPFKDIGLAVLWGHDFSIHPDAGVYWYTEHKKTNFLVLNSVQVSYALNTTVPKWTFRKLLEGREDIFPKEMYFGMGLSTPQELGEFRQGLKSDGIVAVQKPLCVHNGISVSFLTQKNLTEIIEQEESLQDSLPETRAKIVKAMNTGLEYSGEDKRNNAFKWYWVIGDKNQYPVAELGASILQEHLEAMPTKSSKTGKLHQGVIRAQLLAGQPIGVMHRFAKTPYKEGETIQLTDRNVHTFWERTDDELEERIVNFLNPILLELENTLKPLTPKEIAQLHDAEVLKRIQS